MVTQPRTSSDTCVAVLILGALPMDLAAKGLFLDAMLGFFALPSWKVLSTLVRKQSSGVICEAQMFPPSVRFNES